MVCACCENLIPTRILKIHVFCYLQFFWGSPLRPGQEPMSRSAGRWHEVRSIFWKNKKYGFSFVVLGNPYQTVLVRISKKNKGKPLFFSKNAPVREFLRNTTLWRKTRLPSDFFYVRAMYIYFGRKLHWGCYGAQKYEKYFSLFFMVF